MSDWKKTNSVREPTTGLTFRTESREVERGWYDWKVTVDGPEEPMKRVKEVEYVLHPTFPDRIRRTRDAESSFQLQSAGWGEFDIVARVVLDNDDERTVVVPLKLT